MVVQVIFEYDEIESNWEVIVKGVKNVTEAYRALNAVVLTCRPVIITGPHEAIERLQGGYIITPTVMA